MEGERDTGGGSSSNRYYVRYAEDSTPAVSTLESEHHSATDSSFRPGLGGGVIDPNDDALLDGHFDDEEMSNSAAALVQYSAASESEGGEKTLTEDGSRQHERMLYSGMCHTPPTNAVFSFARPLSKGSQWQSAPRERCSSVHIIAISSATSDGTMIDHGALTDQVVVQTPVRRQKSRKEVVKAYLSQSAKGGRYLTSWNGTSIRKSFASPHREKSNNPNHGRGGNHAGTFRSNSCPVSHGSMYTPCTSQESLPVTLSYFPLERRSSPACGMGRSRSADPKTGSESMLQYRLAVMHAKKGKYAFSIRDLLANCDGGDDDDDDDDEQEESTAMCES